MPGPERGAVVSPGVRERVLAALGGVRDPELDEPVTALGFVEGVEAGPGVVEVRLRLPTYFCAPNFAYLMAADAKAAVRGVVGEGVEVRVRLGDHFAAAAINRAVAEDLGFEGAFGEEAGGGLEALRARFARKAFLARQERLCRWLLRQGWQVAELAGLTLGELPAGEETERYLARRAELGLDTAGGAPFLVDAEGRPLPAGALAGHLRFARTIGVSMQANAGFCQGLLRTRYGLGSGKEAS